MSEKEYCLGGCDTKVYSRQLHVCGKCKKAIKKGGIKYCPKCAKEAGVCPYCGLPLPSQK